MRSRIYALRLGLGALVVSASLPATAAYPTRVLSAGKADDTFDVDLGVQWSRNQRTAKITREWIQQSGNDLRAIDIRELEFKEITQTLTLDLRVGVWRDLEIHVSAPIVLQNNSNISFADDVQGKSTLCCAGDVNADDPNAAPPRYPTTEVPAQRYRGGFGDMTFGLAWSPFVDREDEAYPTLTLRSDIVVPTGDTRDPADQDALDKSKKGSIGRGLTVFDLSIAASRRMQLGTPALDPYLVFGAQIPVASASQKNRGMKPPASGRFLIGTEVVMHDNPNSGQHYSLDLSFQTRYVGAGRTYSELSDYLPNFNPTRVLQNETTPRSRPDEFLYSDFANPSNYAVQDPSARCGTVDPISAETRVAGTPCGELNMVDEFVELKGSAVLHLGFSKYVFMRAGVALQSTSDHFLTNERVGTDRDPSNTAPLACDGADCSGRVNARNSFFDRDTNTCPAGFVCDERNPYYDPRYDALGRRIRLEQSVDWTVFLSGVATF